MKEFKVVLEVKTIVQEYVTTVFDSEEAVAVALERVGKGCPEASEIDVIDVSEVGTWE